MKPTDSHHLVTVLLAVSLALGLMGALQAEPLKEPAMPVTDCVKCHTAPAAAIATNGARHRTVTCLDCHPGHRPASQHNIPACSDCHTGTDHLALKECSSCHRVAHTPLVVSFGYSVTDPCLTCHTAQIQQLRENKSKHTNLACSSCHNLHRVAPLCVQCHKPHSADMVQEDCTKCHQAHKPTVVAFEKELPNKDCAACHDKAVTRLGASTSKHKKLSCVFCHGGRHRTVPTCQSCHDAPHAANIMEKFPNCSDCHNIAHDLNSWPGNGVQ